MAIVQDIYDIPEDISIGLLTGIYKRFGSVVRWADGPHKGEIVKHLKPISMPDTTEAQGMAAKAIEIVKNNKPVMIAGLAVVGTATVASGIYYYVTHHEAKVVKEFRKSLKAYVNAIRQGNMTIDIVEDMLEKLERLHEHKDFEKISIKLSAEELDILVSRICDYTIKLAHDNNYQIEPDYVERTKEHNGSIIDFTKYLKIQKDIFSAA